MSFDRVSYETALFPLTTIGNFTYTVYMEIKMNKKIKIVITLAMALLMAFSVSMLFACGGGIGEENDDDNQIPLPQTFIVTFNTHGGTNIASQTVESGQPAARPATNPSRYGYIFLSWLTMDAPTEVFDFSTPITADTVIHARWRQDMPPVTNFTVSFNGHGGTVNLPADQTIADGQTASRPVTAPGGRSGYTFVNWFTAETGGEVFDFSTPITADTVIHARWTVFVRTFTVSFSTQRHYEVPSQQVAEGGFAVMPDVIPVHPDNNVVFYAWTINNPTHYGVWPFSFENEPITSNRLLVARWGYLVGDYFVTSISGTRGTNLIGLTELGLQQTNLTVPYGITDLSYQFWRAPNLRYLTLPSSLRNHNTVAGGPFNISEEIAALFPDFITINRDFSVTWYYGGNASIMRSIMLTRLAHVIITDEVGSIAPNAFSKVTGITRAEILESVTFAPNSSLTVIAAGAFEGTNITSIEIPASVVTIHADVFRNTMLDTVTFENGSNLEFIGDRVFEGVVNVTDLELPDSVTTIGVRAFGNMTGLQSLIIPSSVVNTRQSIFYGMTSNQRVYLPFREGATPSGWDSNWHVGSNATFVFAD